MNNLKNGNEQFILLTNNFLTEENQIIAIESFMHTSSFLLLERSILIIVNKWKFR